MLHKLENDYAVLSGQVSQFLMPTRLRLRILVSEEDGVFTDWYNCSM